MPCRLQNVALAEDLWNTLREEAKRRERPISWLVSRALRRYLNDAAGEEETGEVEKK
jgi:hypothetical protein